MNGFRHSVQADLSRHTGCFPCAKFEIFIMKDVESTINANGVEIRVASSNEADYISLTDIAKKRNPEFPADVVKN